jgi:AcrR family transcriptional regulator
VAAAQRVLARDGLAGMRVREVAAEAQLSPASVLYYFPDSFQLAVQALELTVHSWATEWAATAASTADPAERLVALVAMEIPDPLPGMRRAVCEIPSQVGNHPELRPLIDFLVNDQVSVISAALQDGVASGVFRRDLDVETAARGMVAVLHATNVYRVCELETAEQARARVIHYAEAVLGCRLPMDGVPREHLGPPAAFGRGAARPPAPGPASESTAAAARAVPQR